MSFQNIAEILAKADASEKYGEQTIYTKLYEITDIEKLTSLTSQEGQNLLMLACVKSLANIAKYLLENNQELRFDLDKQDNNGYTALMYSLLCDNNEMDEVAIILLNEGADPMLIAKDKYTAFIIAAKFKKLKITQLMPNGYNININYQDNGQYTIFMYACENGWIKMCKRMLEEDYDLS